MAHARILRIHHIVHASRSNGPGVRAVVWTQGCSLACQGCFNPETHAVSAGERIPVPDIARELINLAPGIEGITISGGEPFQQAPALASLLKIIRQSSNLSILIFTGYTMDELKTIPAAVQILDRIDVLIAGRYDVRQHLGKGLLGSANKTLHFTTSRYKPTDITSVPDAEVLIEQDGNILLSGIHPLTWPPEKQDAVDR